MSILLSENVFVLFVLFIIAHQLILAQLMIERHFKFPHIS